MTPEDTTIVVNGRATRVTLVAESEVTRGRLAGAVRREHVDCDGGLVVRYDQDLTEAELLATRAAQAQDPVAQVLAGSLSPAQRERVLKTPSGTVVRVEGKGWARHGTLYLVGAEATLVPRLLLAPVTVPKPAVVEPCPVPRLPLHARHGRLGDRGFVRPAPPAPPPVFPAPPEVRVINVTRGRELVSATVLSSRPRVRGYYVGWEQVTARTPDGAETEYVGKDGVWLNQAQWCARRLAAQGALDE